MLLLLVLSVIALSSGDICSDLAISDGVTIGELVNAGCAPSIISRARRSEEETYHNNDDGHQHEEDVHAHDDDHDKDSASTICEENANHLWCPTEGNMGQCFDTNEKNAEYCACIDGGTTPIWNNTTKLCTSAESTACAAKDSAVNAYWKGVCHTKTSCEIAKLTWKAAGDALCASAIYFCGLAAGARFSKSKCVCPEGTKWHMNSECHDNESAPDKCDENGSTHKWCPTENNMGQCLNTASDANDAVNTEYCKCSDGGTNPIWNNTAKVCSSNESTTCADKDRLENAYWKGACYTEEGCGTAKLTWKAGKEAVTTGDTPTDLVPARCATEVWFCGIAAETSFTPAQDTGDDDTAVAAVCTCPAGSEWHAGTHCHAHHEDDTTKPSKAAAWGFGFIAVAIISAFAIFGVIIVIFRDKWWYDIVLSTMVALAVGCLLADALLHLVPLALGLHEHEGHDDHAGHSAEEEDEETTGKHNTLNKCMGVLGGVYLFLLFEKAIHSAIPHDHGGGDGHEHGGKVIDNPNAGAELKDLSPRRESLKSVAKKGIWNVDSVAWMVIFGDALHNFADGLVLGASFAASLSLGLGTSIAVFCHELPHELGDFAVLLNAGMQVKWAIIFNFISACTCFLGLFLGLIIGEDAQTQQWIFAFTAGMFIYISCADLIPEMNRMCESSSHPKICFLLQQVGFWVGVVIMLLIALYEEQLEALGKSDGGESAHNH